MVTDGKCMVVEATMASTVNGYLNRVRRSDIRKPVWAEMLHPDTRVSQTSALYPLGPGLLCVAHGAPLQDVYSEKNAPGYWADVVRYQQIVRVQDGHWYHVVVARFGKGIQLLESVCISAGAARARLFRWGVDLPELADVPMPRGVWDEDKPVDPGAAIKARARTKKDPYYLSDLSDEVTEHFPAEYAEAFADLLSWCMASTSTIDVWDTDAFGIAIPIFERAKRTALHPLAFRSDGYIEVRFQWLRKVNVEAAVDLYEGIVALFGDVLSGNRTGRPTLSVGYLTDSEKRAAFVQLIKSTLRACDY